MEWLVRVVDLVDDPVSKGEVTTHIGERNEEVTVV